MFLPQYTEDGHVLPWQELPAAAITPKKGLLLRLSAGMLVLCTGSNAPEFICNEERSSAVSAGTMIKVSHITHDTVFRTTFSASPAALSVGDKVTVHTDALQVTNVTEDSDHDPIGVAEIVKMHGTTTGSEVDVRF